MASGRVRFEALDETPASQGVFGGIICSVLLAIVVVGVAYLTESELAGEKVATALIQPIGLMWLVLFGCVWMAWRRQSTVLAVFLLLTWLWISLWGNGFVAGFMQRTLESQYERIEPMETKPLDAIVLLGGGTSMAPSGELQLGPSGDRVMLAARLYHAGLADRVVCTGEHLNSGDVDNEVEQDSPAAQAKKLLMEVQVDEVNIAQIGGRNTFEEIVALKQWLEEQNQTPQDEELDENDLAGDDPENADPKRSDPERSDLESSDLVSSDQDGSEQAEGEEVEESAADKRVKRVGVITSAWHMARVEALAARNSIDIVPLPCDFRAEEPWSLRFIVPSGDAMSDSGRVFKEYLARMLGR